MLDYSAKQLSSRTLYFDYSRSNGTQKIPQTRHNQLQIYMLTQLIKYKNRIYRISMLKTIQLELNKETIVDSGAGLYVVIRQQQQKHWCSRISTMHDRQLKDKKIKTKIMWKLQYGEIMLCKQSTSNQANYRNIGICLSYRYDKPLTVQVWNYDSFTLVYNIQLTSNAIQKLINNQNARKLNTLQIQNSSNKVNKNKQQMLINLIFQKDLSPRAINQNVQNKAKNKEQSCQINRFDEAKKQFPYKVNQIFNQLKSKKKFSKNSEQIENKYVERMSNNNNEQISDPVSRKLSNRILLKSILQNCQQTFNFLQSKVGWRSNEQSAIFKRVNTEGQSTKIENKKILSKRKNSKNTQRKTIKNLKFAGY